MPANPRKGQTGYQPATNEPERRAFFDALREAESLRDRVAALEATQVTTVVGVYTPTLSSTWVVGTGGVNTADYTYVGDSTTGLLILDGQVKFGTAGQTFPGNPITLTLPSGYEIDSIPDAAAAIGWHECVDDSGGISFIGSIRPNTATTVRPILANSNDAANYLRTNGTTTTTPFIWAQNDELNWHVHVRAVRV